MASRFGVSERAISQGMEMASATFLAGLAGKVGDSAWMNRLFQMVSHAPARVDASEVASAVLDPTRASSEMRSLLNSGNEFLAHAFGANQTPIFDSVAKSTGLGFNAISALMSVAAPLMMTSLGRLVREDRLDPAGLGRILTHEAGDVQGMLPPGVSALVGAGSATAASRPLAMNVFRDESPAPPPLSVTAIPQRRRSLAWLWVIPLALLALFIWGVRARHPVTTAFRPGAPNAVAPAPGRTVVNVIQDPAAARLLAYIQNASRPANRAAQFDFDRILFATGSSVLLPASRGQVDDISRILKAYPNVRLLIVGHTDNVGNAAMNQRLSEARARALKARLAAMGISPDRLETQGNGYRAPTANNATAQGRAMNRRVSVAVIQK